ncbi:hypothetical protein [Rhodanobacter sp. OK091]|uniref:hypothetical protein n=1 Tax=Rhodanobacter sp. OK091 TaxID=1881037 RepID=UPI0009195ABC|nr:hypothetical protein [Rhodanobacter sp. OK091]SHM52350.1 hypothetical protein SAMN05428972_3902 [Rhodanobacter sp. OK091]
MVTGIAGSIQNAIKAKGNSNDIVEPVAAKDIGICHAGPLHAFENKKPFTTKTLQHIQKLREIYGLDLTAEDSHKLKE